MMTSVRSRLRDAADLVDPKPFRQARDPVALLQISGEVADRVEAPGGCFPREPNRFERDCDFGAPSPPARRSGRQPVGVPGDVPRAPVVRPTFVLLGAQRVHHEHVGVVVVVEGVEDEGHRVVLPHLAVAPGDRAGDGGGIRVAAVDPEIDHPFVVEHPDDRPLGRRRAGDRLELGEGLDAGGAAPVRLVQHAVDFDGLRRSRRCDFLGGEAGTAHDYRNRSEEDRQTMAHRPPSIPRPRTDVDRPQRRRCRFALPRDVRLVEDALAAVGGLTAAGSRNRRRGRR